jgi:hypothetical protein
MSKWKNSKSWNRGQRIEKAFASVLKHRDPNYRKANREEQFRHIDYFTSFGTIDVKAKKKISRSDENEQEEFVWVEFQNVQGRDGWLRSGADIIAFERENEFVLVNRNYILGMAQVKCDLTKRVTSSKDALYKAYQREGRKDLISIVKMSDIINMPHRIWKK